MRDLGRNIGAAALFVIISTGTASADQQLCDREIEGVTVRMSLDEARLVWISRGYVEITQVNVRGARGGIAKRVDFADRQPQINEGYRPKRITLSLADNGSEINLSKQFHDEGGAISRARIAEFCPNGPSRTAPVFCADMRNGEPGMRLNITVEPDDPQAAGQCTYHFGGIGLISEDIRLRRAPMPETPGVNAYGIPMPNPRQASRRPGR